MKAVCPVCHGCGEYDVVSDTTDEIYPVRCTYCDGTGWMEYADNEVNVVIVGCGHAECDVTKEWDESLGSWYFFYDCPVCGYYWEGPMYGYAWPSE